MTARELVESLLNSGVAFHYYDGKLQCDSPIPLSDETKELLRSFKPEIIKIIETEGVNPESEKTEVAVRSDGSEKAMESLLNSPGWRGWTNASLF